MAKYLMSVFGPDSDYDKDNYGYESPEQMQESFAATEAFNKKLQDEGYFVFADGLERPSSATVVDGTGEKPVFTDGPFAEAREAVGGFCLIDVSDLDAAIKVAERIPGAKFGRVEIRPVTAYPAK